MSFYFPSRNGITRLVEREVVQQCLSCDLCRAAGARTSTSFRSITPEGSPDDTLVEAVTWTIDQTGAMRRHDIEQAIFLSWSP